VDAGTGVGKTFVRHGALAGVDTVTIGVERSPQMYELCCSHLTQLDQSDHCGKDLYVAQMNVGDLDMQGATSLGRYSGSPTGNSDEVDEWAKSWASFFGQDAAVFGWDTKLDSKNFRALNLSDHIKDQYEVFSVDGDEGGSHYKVHLWIRKYQHRKHRSTIVVSDQLASMVRKARERVPPNPVKKMAFFCRVGKCEAKFERESMADVHMRDVHDLGDDDAALYMPKIKCSVCNRQFKTAALRDEHEHTQHVSCKECGDVLLKTSLRTHMARHKENKNACGSTQPEVQKNLMIQTDTTQRAKGRKQANQETPELCDSHSPRTQKGQTTTDKTTKQTKTAQERKAAVTKQKCQPVQKAGKESRRQEIVTEEAVKKAAKIPPKAAALAAAKAKKRAESQKAANEREKKELDQQAKDARDRAAEQKAELAREESVQKAKERAELKSKRIREVAKQREIKRIKDAAKKQRTKEERETKAAEKKLEQEAERNRKDAAAKQKQEEEAKQKQEEEAKQKQEEEFKIWLKEKEIKERERKAARERSHSRRRSASKDSRIRSSKRERSRTRSRKRSSSLQRSTSRERERKKKGNQGSRKGSSSRRRSTSRVRTESRNQGSRKRSSSRRRRSTSRDSRTESSPKPRKNLSGSRRNRAPRSRSRSTKRKNRSGESRRKPSSRSRSRRSHSPMTSYRRALEEHIDRREDRAYFKMWRETFD
jgi:hypothetical protein